MVNTKGRLSTPHFFHFFIFLNFFHGTSFFFIFGRNFHFLSFFDYNSTVLYFVNRNTWSILYVLGNEVLLAFGCTIDF